MDGWESGREKGGNDTWVGGWKEGNKLCTLSTLRINSDVYKACDTVSIQSTDIFIPFQTQKAAILVIE